MLTLRLETVSQARCMCWPFPGCVEASSSGCVDASSLGCVDAASSGCAEVCSFVCADASSFGCADTRCSGEVPVLPERVSATGTRVITP